MLDDLGTDGRKDLHGMYVFRRPLRIKMVTLTSQVNAMLLEHRIKVLGSLLGELDDDDRTEVLTNWENHDVDDDFSLSETSSIGSVDELNTGQRQQQSQQQPESQQQQQQQHIIDFEEEEKKEEEHEEQQDNNQWNSDGESVDKDNNSNKSKREEEEEIVRL